MPSRAPLQSKMVSPLGRAGGLGGGIALWLVFASACGPELSRISKIDTVRILAVQKSAPYAAPGEVVDLEMLWEGAKPREVETFFGFWCVNPPGNLYSECFRGLPQVAPRFVLNENKFSLRMPENVLQDPGPGGGGIPFGTAYVFYGVCKGRLVSEGVPLTDGLGGQGGMGPVSGFGGAATLGGAGGGAGSSSTGSGGTSPADRNDLPLNRLSGLPRCVDAAGGEVGSSGFVIGYSQIFAYDGYRNKNPEISGFELDGKVVEPDCLDSGCVGRPVADLPPLSACDSEHICLDVCSQKTGVSCIAQPFAPVVSRSSAEADEVARDGFGTELEEGLWVSYFVDNGGLSSELRLVNDATQGWIDDFSTKVTGPDKPGPITLWAVVRDNRGGVSFGRLRGYARSSR